MTMEGDSARSWGLGQDLPPDMPPPDVGIDTSIVTPFPISYTPPNIAPSFLPYIPSPVVDTQSAPITGTLVDTTPAATVPASSVLTSIFSGIQNVLSSTSALVKPKTAGTAVALPGQPGYVAPAATASWFSQPSVLGVPNWGMLAGLGVLGIGLFAAMRSGSGSSYSEPRRRRNPAELILMGANPSAERIAFARSLKRQSKRTRKLALRSVQTKTTPRRFAYGMERYFSKG